MAETILANRGVPSDEISIVLGHRFLDPITAIYIIHRPDYLRNFKAVLDDIISDLTRMAGLALHSKLIQVDNKVSALRA